MAFNSAISQHVLKQLLFCIMNLDIKPLNHYHISQGPISLTINSKRNLWDLLVTTLFMVQDGARSSAYSMMTNHAPIYPYKSYDNLIPKALFYMLVIWNLCVKLTKWQCTVQVTIKQILLSTSKQKTTLLSLPSYPQLFSAMLPSFKMSQQYIYIYIYINWKDYNIT